MKLLVITGLFGSGKTSLLLRALRLSAREFRLRTVVVQNEIGRVGVDPEFFRTEDVEVDELLGGCICCSLAARLIGVLAGLARAGTTDLVCIEASGIATPSMVRRILEGTEFAGLPAYYINLLDAARLQKLEKLLSLPLVRDGVTASDLCVVNKMDAAPEGFRAALDEKLAALGSPAAVCFANLQDSESLPGAGAEPLRRFLASEPREPAAAPQSPEGHRHAHHHHGEPAVCAEESSRDDPALLPGPRAAAAFDALVRAVEAAGGTVAHIKAVLAGRDGGRVFLQSTGTGSGTPADLPRDIAPARIIINAIAWNIRPGQLRALTREFICTCHDSSKP